jgi:hypothetical protein
VWTRNFVESSRVLRRRGAYVGPIRVTCVFHLGTFIAGQVCYEWQPWGKYLGISSILGQSLFHSFAYILLSVRDSPQSEIFSHFHIFSDSFRNQCRGFGDFICPIVSPTLANVFDSLLDCERQRFSYWK